MSADTINATSKRVDFTLPSLGSDMEEGTVISWLVGVGDVVHKGDVLLRVDTEKSDIDVEIWHDATVVDLLVEPGETVPVGAALAHLEVPNPASTDPPGPETTVSEPRAPETTAPDPPRPETTVSEPRAPETTAPESGGPETAPSESPVSEPSGLVGIGPRLVYWPAPQPERSSGNGDRTEPGPHPTVPAGPLPTRSARRQAAVAALMEQANREIPHFHVVRTIDVSDALAWLEARNDASPPTERVLPAALLLSVVAIAAHGSDINGTFADDAAGPTPSRLAVDLGVAVHLRDGGLVTPVISAAHELTVDELMTQLKAIVARARSGRMSSADMTAATLTVTNLGEAGADRVLGVIRPPQRALVGIGAIALRPAVVDGALTIRSLVDVTLTADHRVVNGHAAARFLAEVAAILSSPNTIGADHELSREAELS